MRMKQENIKPESNEVWKELSGFEGLYQISNMGRINALERKWKIRNGGIFTKKEKILKGVKQKTGYLFVCLYKDGVKYQFLIHRLVAMTFIDNIQNLPEVNHKNGIKTDNRASELEWSSKSENLKHAFKIGLKRAKKGAENICSRAVQQLSKTGELIKIFGSTKEAEGMLGIDHRVIGRVANGRPNNKTAGGYVWKYLENK